MVSKKYKTFFVISLVFSVISVIGACFTGIFGIEFLRLQASPNNDLGEGLASVFMVLLSVVSIGASVIASIPGITFSTLCFRQMSGKGRVVSLIALVFDSVTVVFGAVIAALCFFR